MSEKELIQKLIDTAKGEVGYLEKASNRDLDSKTGNPGSANYTKYGRDMHALYPSVMDFPAAWCDCFVDWCFYKTFGTANAKGLLAGDFNDYTVASAQLYKKKKAYHTSDPQPGDQIFFHNATRICHTGIVTEVSGGLVYTVEGNTSSGPGVVANGGCVAAKKYSLTDPDIDGYGRPNYAAYVTQEEGRKSIRELIDLSYYNTLDFAQASTRFQDVIIRIGYRSRKDGSMVVDKKFLEHTQNAIAHGFRYGFYLMDQAINETEAIQEADWVAGLVKPLTVTYPIFIDSEYSGKNHDGRADGLSKEQRTKNVIAFCEQIRKYGYMAGIYASNSWFTSMLDFPRLTQYEIWCARYSTKEPTVPHYEIWQHGSEVIPGAKSAIDVNYVYKDYAALGGQSPAQKPDTEVGYCTVTAANSLYIREQPSSNAKAVGVLHHGDKVSVCDVDGKWYRISETENKWCSSAYLAGTSATIANCSKLNCRKVPVSGQILFVLKCGQTVDIIGKDDASGWYFIAFNKKVGYISPKYVSL